MQKMMIVISSKLKQTKDVVDRYSNSIFYYKFGCFYTVAVISHHQQITYNNE